MPPTLRALHDPPAAEPRIHWKGLKRFRFRQAATVVPIQEHETLSRRALALVPQAWTNLASHARLHKVVFDRGFWDGVDL
jgi:hypothetical protein